MMHMTFYWGRSVTLLFDSWQTDSWLSYGLTLLACFVVSGFYQYLEDKRRRVTQIGAKKPADMEVPLLQKKISGKLSVGRITGTVLFGVNSGLGYLLMLAVMSFNGGVFLAIVAGLTVGYLVFGSGETEDVGVAVDNPCACA
ncbi:copper transporter 5.1-like [Mangifera indica]|uniref:copper transporter 5.1-like n=1 Tax=Mangifera indica TaxID=29780 RepID=UPI001CFA5DC2|nr:copper transporter 5.1-like [Mangifera indica]